MPVAIASSQSGQQASGTSVSVTPPASIANGDLLLALSAFADGTATIPAITYPSGFVAWDTLRLSGRFLFEMATKIAASEAGNYVFGADDTMDLVSYILRITGHAASGYKHAADKTQTSLANSHPCPSVNCTVPGCLILYCAQQATNSAVTIPGGVTTELNISQAGDTSQRVIVMSKILAGTGASGTCTLTTGATKSMGLFTFAIAPPSAGGSPLIGGRLFNSPQVKGILVR